MLYISDSAAQRVSQIMMNESYGEDYFVRVKVAGGGCSGLSYDLSFDNKTTEEDQIFSDKGIRLVTDLMSFLYVCNSTLEFTDGLHGSGFHWTNPNASRTCACGESFSV